MSFWRFFLDLLLSCALLIGAFVALVNIVLRIARKMSKD